MTKLRDMLSTVRPNAALAVAWLGFAVLGSAAPLCAAAAAAAEPAKDAAKEQKCDVSEKFRNKYKVAADAAQKNDWAAALPAAKDAYTEAKKPCEQMYAVSVERTAAYNLKDDDALIAAAKHMNATEGVTEKDRATNLQVIYQTLIKQKKYDESIPALKDYIAVAGASAESLDLLARLDYQQKDCAGATDTITKIQAAGQATEQQLLMAQDCYYKAKDTAHQAAATEELLYRFPKDSYMIGVLALNQGGDERQLLNLYRLAFAKGYLQKQAQIVDYATLAERSGVASEAQKVLEKASTEKWITLDDSNTKLLTAEKRNAADDRKGLPALDKEARAGKSGNKDVAVGYAYFGLEDYVHATEAIQRGLAADRVGDVKRVDDANMVLGISFARLGKFDEATKAFTAAKADPRMTKAADAWLALMKN